MPFQVPPARLLALLLGLAACSQPEAFVETPDLGKLGRTKALYERVTVCFTDKDNLSKIQKLADEECARGQKKAHYLGFQRWQCRLTVPHLAQFVCLAPDQSPGDKRQYLQGQGSGLPPIDQPDAGGDFFGTFGIGK
ncbi:MAG: hypothetical protein HZA67_02195 [Rhodospirillales bacterium]|jgi:hypothetical protein|nr:hypothetical protein [Rhodospirillales bacterium]